MIFDMNANHPVYTASEERKIESEGDPDAFAQCNVDIEHTRLVCEAAKCAPESRTDSQRADSL